MALQFISVNHGSGDYGYIYRTICKQSKEKKQASYLFLVPEQSTLQAQRELAAWHEDHVLGTIDVLSFARLAHRVLLEQNKKESVFLNDTGKAMILRKAVGHEAGQLELFGRSIRQSGFVQELKNVIHELSTYGVTDELLQQICGMLDDRPVLKRKLRDIEQVYKAFRRELGEVYMTAEELLGVLAQQIPSSGWLKNCTVVLSGFTGFTPLQYQVLEQLLGCCRHVVCVLSGETEAGRETLFAMNTEVKNKLSQLAADHGVRIDPLVRTCPQRKGVNPELSHLEQQLYRHPLQAWDAEPKGIHLVQAANPREELAFVFRRVLELIRQGYCYREIAIVAGDLEVYSSDAAQQCQQAGIPFFIDQKKTLKANPLIRMVRQALAVLREQMSYDSVMAFLRNPLVSLETDCFDLLDNYLLASGIDHIRRWKHNWAMPYAQADEESLTVLNAQREMIYGWFEPLRQVWEAPEADVRSRMCAMVSFLEQFSVQERLEQMQEQFRQEGAYYLESEYAQVLPKLWSMFDQIVGMMGEEQLESELLMDMLDSGFEELQVGFIPASVDRLVIGDVMRTRLDHIRVLFVVGANDRLLPKENQRGGILNDYDRELLRERGMELSLPAREEIFQQQYYLYLLLTNPTEQLYLTNSRLSADGKQQRPAHILSHICRIFPNCRETDAADWESGLAALTTKEEGFRQLTKGLRQALDGKECEWWKPLYQYYAGETDYQKPLERLRSGLFYNGKTEQLDSKIARRLFGNSGTVSISRLEKYASCPYAHFLNYGMGLRERRQFEIQGADYGSLFHSAIHHFFTLLEKRGLDWNEIDEAVRSGLVEESVHHAIQEYQTTIFDSSERNKAMAGRIRRMTDRTVWALQHQWNQGTYETIWHETDFGKMADLIVQLPGQQELEFSLQGRIDRIDLAKQEELLYVKVIDYKTSNTKLDLEKIFYGIQLQLVLYLDAAMKLAQKRFPQLTPVPGGMFYYNMKDPLVEGFGLSAEEIQEKQLKELRMNGYANAQPAALRMIDKDGGQVVMGLEYKKDGSLSARAHAGTPQQLAGLRSFARKKAMELANAVYDGKIEINPYYCAERTACEYCPFHSICGFDPKTEGFGYRQLKHVDKEAMWEMFLADADKDPGEDQEEKV